ncbi:cytoplasmic 60S subunit biogenesis factor REI1 homolog 2-like isoform X2 [Carex rostrata]
MAPITCNACNKEFEGEVDQKEHYRSEWHRYNLKRKVAGVPSVTEALFLARQAALVEEKSKSSPSQMLYTCSLCSKEYRSSKAHQQHLNSKSHMLKASLQPETSAEGITVIKPLVRKSKRVSNKAEVEEEEEEEWVEMGSDEEMEEGDEVGSDEEMEGMEELDPSSCFMCDAKHENIESCIVHMHKKHGFFIPDVEFLKDAEGLLIYVSLQVKRDYTCLYCNERRQPFQSLEAVRKHMDAKGHCKLRYGDGGDDEDADLDEFYDYSSSYVNAEGKQVVLSDDAANVELGSAGAELVITHKNEEGMLVRTLGSREFLRYYRQKPRPTPARNTALATALAIRYKSMGLATVQSREQIVRMKVLKEMNK